MNLHSLRYFAGVAEELSFSGAADRMNVSQSALSRQIQLLEADLGVRLFDRIGRRIVLTPAGQELLARCNAILKDVRSLRLRARELSGGTHGFLRVGATPQTLESVISRFLRHYRRKFPEAEVLLIEDGAARLSQHVESGRIDVAIGALTAGSALEGRRLFPLGVLVVLPAGHPLKGRRTVEVSELADQHLLLLSPQFITRLMFDGACQVAHLKPRVLLESNSPQCLLSLVAAGQGIAILPSTVLLKEMECNAVPLRHEGKQLGFWMSAVWDPRRYMSPLTQAFINELHDAVRRDYPGKRFGFTKLAPGPSWNT
jgi:LysR family cyn operon transcriptional activator